MERIFTKQEIATIFDVFTRNLTDFQFSSISYYSIMISFTSWSHIPLRRITITRYSEVYIICSFNGVDHVNERVSSKDFASALESCIEFLLS